MVIATIFTITLLVVLCNKTYQKYRPHYLINPGFYFGLSWMITLMAHGIPLFDYASYPDEYFRLLIYVNTTAAIWLLLLYVPAKRNTSNYPSRTNLTRNVILLNYDILWFLATTFGIICLFGSVVIFVKMISIGDLLERRIFYVERPSVEYLYFEWLYLAGQVSSFLFGYSLKKTNKLSKYIIGGIPFYASILFSMSTGRRQHMLFIIIAYLFGILISQDPVNIRTIKERIKYYLKMKRRNIIIISISIIVFIQIFGYIHSLIPPIGQEYYLTELGDTLVWKAIFTVIPMGLWDYLVKPIYSYQSRVRVFRTFDIQYGRHSFWPVEYIAVKLLASERKLSGSQLALYFDEFFRTPATIFCGFTYDFGEDLVIVATILMVLISFGLFRLFITKPNFSIFRSILLLHICIFWIYSTQFSYFSAGGELLILWAFLAHISYQFLKKLRVK